MAFEERYCSRIIARAKNRHRVRLAVTLHLSNVVELDSSTRHLLTQFARFGGWIDS
jgi:hypothetical protein